MKTTAADVVIVGAGPAGAAAAAFLAREGVDVVALDRATFPRDKICGDGLTPRAVEMLRRLGVERRLQEMGYRPQRQYRIVSAWGDAVRAGMPSFGKGAGYAYVVPRRDVDLCIVEAARASGAQVLESVQALRLEGSDTAPEVVARCADGELQRFRGRVLISADGSRGSFSRTFVPSEHLRPNAVAMRAYMHGVEGLQGALNFFLDRHLLPGYGWIFPPGRPGAPANVGVGVELSSWRGRDEKIRDLFDWFLGPGSQAWPHLHKAEFASAPRPFPLLLDFPRGRRRDGSRLLVGDAANLIDPLSGEGIAYALESGHLAAMAVSRALRSGRVTDLARYDVALWRTLAVEFFGAYLLRQLLVRPWGNGVAIRLLQRDAGLARGGIGVLSNSVPSTWFVRPTVLRRILSPARAARTVMAAHPAKG
jgi:geranylgeranyl reductase family protein